MPWGPIVTEELRNDVRFAIGELSTGPAWGGFAGVGELWLNKALHRQPAVQIRQAP
jgi:hypothetical protein